MHINQINIQKDGFVSTAVWVCYYPRWKSRTRANKQRELLDVIDSHDCLNARGAVITVDHPTLGPIKLIGSPMHFVDRTTPYRPPPTLGEHTSAVLEELPGTVTEP